MHPDGGVSNRISAKPRTIKLHVYSQTNYSNVMTHVYTNTLHSTIDTSTPMTLRDMYFKEIETLTTQI